MKNKLAIATFATLAVPATFGAVMAFHPGIAFAETPLAQQAPAPLQGGSFTTDPMHTCVGFEIGHLGLSRIQGRFDKTSGHIVADPKNLDASSVTFTAQTESVDTNVAPRDAHLKTPDFFDAAKYPEIKFVSTKIRKKGKGYVAEGDLTIKATTKHIEIPFKAYGPITDPWGGTRVGIVADPIKIDRQAYGIAYNEKLPNGEPAVSNEVTIRLSVEATLDKK